MSASLLSLPYELRANILLPLLNHKGTIELQQPIWADKSVFVHPLTQVCHCLRAQTIALFYQANVFVWVLDPEEDSKSDPTTYPVDDLASNRARLSGPLDSVVPWRYPHLMRDIRHIRLNIYLPTSHDKKAWAETFPQRLKGFVRVLEQGRRLKDLRVLVGTWYTLLNLSESQKAAFDVLEQMQVRGLVQVRAKNIYKETRESFRALELERRMKADGKGDREFGKLTRGEPGAGGRYLDWEWEGGGLLG